MHLRRASIPGALSTALLLAALTIAAADVSKANTINATDTFNWATNFGGEFNTIPNGSTAVSDSGLLTALISFSGGGDGERVDQGSGWDGNFLNGAPLLWTGSPGQGPLQLDFSRPLTAIGFQIQADYFGPFTVGLLASDGRGNVVGSAFATGDSNSNADGSALFLGFTGDKGFTNVSIIQTDCACDNTDFTIGQVNVTTVPEPGSFTLMFLAAGPVALLLRRIRRKRTETNNPLELRKGQV